MTPEQLVQLAVLHPGGYISSRAPGFNTIPIVGRITSWPDTKPEEWRSVACRCSMHPSCSSAAKARRKVTDYQLQKWLFRRRRGGRWPPNTRRSLQPSLQGLTHHPMLDNFEAALVGLGVGPGWMAEQRWHHLVSTCAMGSKPTPSTFAAAVSVGLTGGRHWRVFMSSRPPIDSA